MGSVVFTAAHGFTLRRIAPQDIGAKRIGFFRQRFRSGWRCILRAKAFLQETP